MKKNSTAQEFANDIIKLILSLPTDSLLMFNSLISNELESRDDLYDCINKKYN